jgi:protoheme IX farnesyltransferase
MERTQARPLVTGAIKPRNALIFALSLQVVAFGVLWSGANLLSAVLAFVAAAFYIGVYTIWLKRSSRQNIVIGGAAGAVPVLVGWSAVQNNITWTPIVLFVVMFLWTPPHFWALAVKYADDYRAADVPMLPSVVSMAETVRQMTLYTLALVVSTLVLLPVAGLGWIYGVAAVTLGAIFLGGTIALGRNPTPQASMRLFGFSITYVTLLFGAMSVDVFVEYGW